MFHYLRYISSFFLFFIIFGCGNGSSPIGGDGAIKGQTVSSKGVVSTISKSFNSPFGITTDRTDLYVADYKNGLIKKIVIATGATTTLAGADVIIAAPAGITTDGTNLYVTDAASSSILKIVIATGRVTPLAGTTAGFRHPYGITTDGTNLYVADSDNNTIKKVVIANGTVTTLAGSTSPGSTDGIGTAASFNRPYGITTDGTNLYIADTGNNSIRKIVIATGAVTTLAGSTSSGASDGTGVTASFSNPFGITTDGTNLYVADTNNNSIRKITIATGIVTTLAGTPPPTLPGSTDTDETTGAKASLNSPYGITTNGINLYVTDTGNNTIRKIQ